MSETKTISLKDVRRAAMACRHASDASKASAAADAEKKFSIMQVLEPLLGIKSEEELQSMDPGLLQHIAEDRIQQGLVELDGIDQRTLFRVIQKSQSRRNVSWKDAYVRELGESEATALIAATDESYSYKFVDIPA